MNNLASDVTEARKKLAKRFEANVFFVVGKVHLIESATWKKWFSPNKNSKS
jgi:hypothetical protein